VPVELELEYVEQEHKDDHESKEIGEGTKNMKGNEDENDIEVKAKLNLEAKLMVV